MSESFYNILGIQEKSSKDEIKKAFRGLSMKWHPDKNLGNPEAVGKFQKISEAYETLSDDQKRQEYDMMNNNPFFSMNQGGGGMQNPDDLFSALFGMPFGMPGMHQMPQGMHQMPGGHRIHVFHGGNPMNFQEAMQKPTPIMKNITINMEQVLNGINMPVDIERWIIENGMKVFEKETIYVNVPKGIDDNEIIILRDKGNILNENLKGDIKLFVKVENTTMFKRIGLDLLIEKDISLKDALCGFNFEIKYVNGKTYTLNNNKGNIIPPEYKKIIPNMGLTREGHTGNLVIHFHVNFPTSLEDEKIDALAKVL